MSSSVGLSVAKARAPRVSMMRFTHSNWTVVRGSSPAEAAAMKLITRAAMFTSPTSASFKAGASFVPSPVTATTCPFCFKHCTIKSLSNGDDLAITEILSTFSILSSTVLPQLFSHQDGMGLSDQPVPVESTHLPLAFDLLLHHHSSPSLLLGTDHKRRLCIEDFGLPYF
ncbi:hypothetical protein C5167_011774 [Papaver somniferum]|nr:hypothetical protein C5167_011774 [Papaver somniferum]